MPLMSTFVDRVALPTPVAVETAPMERHPTSQVSPNADLRRRFRDHLRRGPAVGAANRPRGVVSAA